MAVWYTTAGTADKTSGTDLNGTHINFTITPVNPDTGVHSGAYLNALNFKIGGATEVDGSGDAATDTGIWSNGNVDTGVAKVQFTDNGLTGDINNTVNAKVTFSSTTPTNDITYFVDVDEKTTNPISYSANRNVCFKVQLPYDENLMYEFYEAGVGPQTFTSQAATGGDVTRTLLNPVTYETDGFYNYQFSGTINNYDEDHAYDIVRVLARRAHLGNALDPLPGVGDPNLNIHDFFITWPPSIGYNYGMDYPSLYMFSYQADEHIHNFFSPTLNSMIPIAYHIDISYNPSDYDFIREHEQGGMCNLGHAFYINIDTTDPTPDSDAADDTVQDLTVRSFVGEEGGYLDIVVTGDSGAEYEIELQQTSSIDTSEAASTGAFYNFSGTGGFQTSRPGGLNAFVLNSSNTHRALIPKSTSDVKYNIFLKPRGSTVIKSGLPTKPGDRAIFQKGISTITLQATAAVAANFDLSTDAASTRAVFTKRKSDTSPVRNKATVLSEVLTAVSASTRIVLKRADSRLTEGMYVMQPFGTGVQRETKITRVNRNIITVDKAATLAAGDEINFVTNTPNIVPFTLVARAGQGSDSDYQNLSVKTGANYKPQEAIGGLTSDIAFTVNGAVNNSQNIIVDQEIYKVRPDMVVIGKGISSLTGKDFITVSSINVATKTITISDAVTLEDNQTINLQENPESGYDEKFEITSVSTSGVRVLHVMGEITVSDADPGTNQERCAISGYLDIADVSQSATLPVYLESVILAEEV